MSSLFDNCFFARIILALLNSFLKEKKNDFRLVFFVLFTRLLQNLFKSSKGMSCKKTEALPLYSWKKNKTLNSTRTEAWKSTGQNVKKGWRLLSLRLELDILTCG